MLARQCACGRCYGDTRVYLAKLGFSELHARKWIEGMNTISKTTAHVYTTICSTSILPFTLSIGSINIVIKLLFYLTNVS